MVDRLPIESTIEDEIGEVSMFRPHVVVLGAGASRAACLSGDAEGRRLPLMADLVDVLGLRSLVMKWKIDPDRNFEVIFGELYAQRRRDELVELQDVVESYFLQLRIPDRPTIYDHLLLSLREHDLVASFNWDPLLIQAYRRNFGMVELPRLCFLHGNVAAGYCRRDRIKGNANAPCSRCGAPLKRAQLLYPIEKKDYSADEFIAAEWSEFKHALKHAFMITVFGYSGPKTDQEAITAMSEAWGPVENRELEQTAFITLQDSNEIAKNWAKFIHTHHYEIQRDFYDSWIANHPRRTGEAYWNQYLMVKFLADNPIPRGVNFPTLWDWFAPFTGPERKAAEERRAKSAKSSPA